MSFMNLVSDGAIEIKGTAFAVSNLKTGESMPVKIPRDKGVAVGAPADGTVESVLAFFRAEPIVNATESIGKKGETVASCKRVLVISGEALANNVERVNGPATTPVKRTRKSKTQPAQETNALAQESARLTSTDPIPV